MHKLPLLIALAISFIISLPVYAFQVKVVSTNKSIQGLGFTVNGKQSGGMGSEYHKAGMTKGNYSFGVRVNGKDIGCKAGGKKQVNLTGNTNVVLNLKGSHCTAEIGS